MGVIFLLALLYLLNSAQGGNLGHRFTLINTGLTPVNEDLISSQTDTSASVFIETTLDGATIPYFPTIPSKFLLLFCCVSVLTL